MITKELLSHYLIKHGPDYILSTITNPQLKSYNAWYQRLCVLMHVPLDRKYTKKLDKLLESKKTSYYLEGNPIQYSYYLAMRELGYRSIYDYSFKEL